MKSMGDCESSHSPTPWRRLRLSCMSLLRVMTPGRVEESARGLEFSFPAHRCQERRTSQGDLLHWTLTSPTSSLKKSRGSHLTSNLDLPSNYYNTSKSVRETWVGVSMALINHGLLIIIHQYRVRFSTKIVYTGTNSPSYSLCYGKGASTRCVPLFLQINVMLCEWMMNVKDWYPNIVASSSFAFEKRRTSLK